MTLTPEEKLDTLPARIAQAAERVAEARQLEAQTMVDLNRVVREARSRRG